MSAPARPFRIVRGAAADYRTHHYKTKARRDEAAQRFAAMDGEPVLTELWAADHPQDALNKGWACDGTANPPGYVEERRPGDPDTSRPHNRTGANAIQSGEDVTVFAFEQGDTPSGFRSGTVATVEAAADHYGSPTLRITFASGERFRALDRAVAYVWKPTNEEGRPS